MLPDLPHGIIPATLDIADYIGRHLRPEHEHEVNALLPIGGANSVRLAFHLSDICLCAIRNNTPLCIFGTSGKAILGDSATIWMLATPEIDKHPLWCGRMSRKVLSLLHDLSGAHRLENRIPVQYHTAIRWLQWLGFSIGKPEFMPLWSCPHVRAWHVL